MTYRISNLCHIFNWNSYTGKHCDGPLNIHFQRIETRLLDIDLNIQFGYNAKQWLQACLEPVDHMQLARKIALHLFCGLVQTKENWL